MTSLSGPARPRMSKSRCESRLTRVSVKDLSPCYGIEKMSILVEIAEINKDTYLGILSLPFLLLRGAQPSAAQSTQSHAAVNGIRMHIHRGASCA